MGLPVFCNHNLYIQIFELKNVECIVPILFAYNAPKSEIGHVVKYINDFLAACVEKYPNRFMALGTLPMQDIDSCIFEIESMGDRLIGYQIGSNINGLTVH